MSDSPPETYMFSAPGGPWAPDPGPADGEVRCEYCEIDVPKDEAAFFPGATTCRDCAGRAADEMLKRATSVHEVERIRAALDTVPQEGWL